MAAVPHDPSFAVAPAEPAAAPVAAAGAGWASRADALAAWASARLVNRTDAWGGYLPERYRRGGSKSVTKPRLALRGRVVLTEAVLRSHFRGRDVGDVAGLHGSGPEGTSRWIAVDVDAHGGATDDPARNRRAALHWYDKLVSLGFAPLLFDSDGRGGFHLWVVFAKPVPAATAFRFARWVVRDHAALGFAKAPEAFPKQAGGTAYGNWLRLPGRHHSRPHRSRIWDGERWLDGVNAADRVLATTGDDPALIPPMPEPSPPPTVAATVAPIACRPASIGEADDSVIDAFNRRHCVEDLLDRYGYVRMPNGMYSRPGRDGLLASVSVRDGRSYHHSTSDRMHDPNATRQRWRRPFALYLAYEHGGDVRAAVRAAALAMGVSREPKRDGPSGSAARRHAPEPAPARCREPETVRIDLAEPAPPPPPLPGGDLVVSVVPDSRGAP